MSIQPAKPDWETYCHHVADMIVQEQTPKRVMDVRGKLYELLSHCIPPHVVLKVRDFSIAVRIPVLVIIGAMPEVDVLPHRPVSAPKPRADGSWLDDCRARD